MLVEPGRAGVLVNESRRAGKADGENILMLVPIEIVRPAEEMIGISLDRLRLGRVDFVLFGEIGPFEPIGAVNRIKHSVAVDVADIRSFGVVIIH